MLGEGEVFLQFAPFASAVDAGFWWKLSQRKLDVYRLDETPTAIRGYYSIDGPPNLSGVMNVDYTAFDESWTVRPFCATSHGILIAKNTVEEFKECNKKSLIDDAAKQIWQDIVSGAALENPELINRFLLLTYVDLKKYIFYYWFAFPALCYPTNAVVSKPPTPVDEYFKDGQKSEFLQAYDSFVRVNSTSSSYFVLHLSELAITVGSIAKFEELNDLPGKVLLGFRDPCTLAGHPGWPLRNFLALISVHWKDKLSSVDVLCLRDRVNDGVRTISHSLVLHLHMTGTGTSIAEEVPACVGWELNASQKKAPRRVDLSASMKPENLAKTSVDLNLKLMRWRLVPSLDLDVVRNCRCLLLGSGTLGCGVARCLLGWGVQNITMVDNGRVSYSNPVRQSLFNFDDCLNGGKLKAHAAADALKRIFPDVNAKGVELSIPMPGHTVSDSDVAHVRADVDKLEKLIEESDVVFLLTDTRESRWLPTLISAWQRKLVMNAALGFDTFLVMRHGVKACDTDDTESTNSQDQATVLSRKILVPGNLLGCYFCNDVVGPADSTRYRTMDQQCTVTRPGISMIAAAMAVELMISVLQHPNRGLAPAEMNDGESDLSSVGSTPLGIVPHQIRGFLSQFHHILPAGRCFDKCTACSKVIVEEYNRRKFEFLLDVFNRPASLEDLSGLTKLHNETQEAEVWALSDTEEDDDYDNTSKRLLAK